MQKPAAVVSLTFIHPALSLGKSCDRTGIHELVDPLLCIDIRGYTDIISHSLSCMFSAMTHFCYA